LENARQLAELERERQELIRENTTLRNAVEDRYTARSILGSSERIENVRQMIDMVASAEVSVLITGENGTGKELAARAIHHGSRRSAGAFVAVNCAALPESLVEAELFGIEKGVATGVERRIGRIQSASGGTLFLDEIGDLSLAAQAKLLRVLQEKEVEWVGGRKPVPVDVRVIAATNKDLAQSIEAGTFRQDLYFRLNIVHIQMPALREIRADLPMLAMHFLQKYRAALGARAARLSDDAMQAMKTYAWPGNVRELENEVKRALVLTSGDVIEAGDLSASVERGSVAVSENGPAKSSDASRGVRMAGKHPLKERVAALEIDMIGRALSETEGDRRKAARRLGLSHQGLINKIKRYGLG
jgi:transcriptional regulator with PAS, ATPase and Fis domain